MLDASLFPDANPVAVRQPKTDRLILDNYLRDAAQSRQLDPDEIEAAHRIVIKWADLETSGRLAQLRETQLQGDFLAEIFGQVLGYARAVDNAATWHIEQHHAIAGQTPDAVLGIFKSAKPFQPLGVVELKGPTVHLDRDRSNGRTAVQQCWGYLNHTDPDCRWGIVSNMVSFRLYERNATPRAYEHFTLQELRDIDRFRRFYVLFHRRGLIEKTAGQDPRAAALLERSRHRQRTVGDELYQHYSTHRVRLIGHLHRDLDYNLDHAIDIAQRLLDRVFFIAFCEDRGLLPGHTIRRAYEDLPAFTAITNPRWHQFKTLFRMVDKGHASINLETGYNGGLFAPHEADQLELDDSWTQFFHDVGRYDFADEVNLDVLGHLFERSITELEKLREGGLFGGDAEKAEQYARMPQSAKRKQLGIYYTPAELTSRVVEYTVHETIHQRFKFAAIHHGIPSDRADYEAPDTPEYWNACLDILRDLKICDPACGSGAFLFQAYEVLEHRYAEVIEHLRRLEHPDADQLADRIPNFILEENLYGVDLSPEAVEITQLALWIRSATPGRTLATLSANIIHGNSLVHDPEAHPAGFNWRQRFPEVFDREHRAGFDCVIGNPPWERIKLQEREFFSLPAPDIATATNAAKRRKRVAELQSEDPTLYHRYQQALEEAQTLLDYCRRSGEYPLTGKGDINTYAVFAELAYQLVAPDGRVGLLTPSGIASDKTTMAFFAAIAESDRLIRFYDFENRTKQLFPDVDGRFKFCLLNFAGSDVTGEEADFLFFAHRMEDIEDPDRHIRLSGDDIKLLNPNTRTCPIFRTRRDAEITKQIYRRVPVLIDRNRKGDTGNPWGIRFGILFHQAKDAEHFTTADELADRGFSLQGNQWVSDERVFLPCYEAKMAQPYDHRAARVRFEQNWARQGQPSPSSQVEHENPEFLPLPRWWASKDMVDKSIAGREDLCLFSFRKVTSPTNTRTLLATLLPLCGAIDSLQFVFFKHCAWNLRCCFLANCNTFSLDYLLRQKIGNVNVNYYLVEQLPFLTPDRYAQKCPWSPNQTLESWISERVLKLTCTAEDMLPLAEACGFTAGSFREYDGKLHKWQPQDRAQLMAELDAAFFLLYGIDRDDAAYILSTFRGIHETNPLLPGHVTTANHILNTYDHLAAPAMSGR